MKRPLKIVCISDTHGRHHRLTIPPGDILIHGGDSTGIGDLESLEEFASFMRSQPHTHKILIAGNHDFALERTPRRARSLFHGLIYLQDEEVEVEGLRIHGSPWQPWFHDWAFNLRTPVELRERWDLIPEGIHILITHGPPRGHGDRLSYSGEAAGCTELLRAIRRVRPRYHIFGHIHEGYGTSQEGETLCVNASSCNFDYEPVNAPVVLPWP